MFWLPLLHRASNKSFVVFGGGKVAERKVRTLQRFGCDIKVVAPEVTPELATLVSGGKVSHAKDLAAENHVQAGLWVVAATDSSDVNAQIAGWAKAKQCPVSVADNPDLSDFIFPAIIDRSSVMITVSSLSQTPALTRYLRNMIDAALPRRLDQLAAFVSKHRKAIRVEEPESAKRQSLWRKIMASPAPDLVLAGKDEEAGHVVDNLRQMDERPVGQVFMVGAGPGDPELLTLKAVRLIQQADVVFYDRLVSKPIMEFCNPSAELHYVGKAKADHAVPQEGINQLLVKHAQLGKTVLRLKGGDPFIFGRGGEEIEELAQYSIPFQIVPGITAASGCASYSGIPLTHRDYAQSVRFVTGHLKDGTANLPWQELIHGQQTLVIYMGLSGIASICEQLIAHGMSAETAIALIEKGTLPEQKVHISNLSDMPKYVENTDISAPTLTVVGDVVNLHEKLAWC